MSGREIDAKPGLVLLKEGDSVAIFLAPGAECPVSERQLETELSGVYFRIINDVVGVVVKEYRS